MQSHSDFMGALETESEHLREVSEKLGPGMMLINESEPGKEAGVSVPEPGLPRTIKILKQLGPEGQENRLEI